MNKRNTSILFLMAFVVLCMGFASCTVSRKTVYFNDLPDTTKFTYPSAQFTEPVIQEDDILSITIQTVDPTTSAQLSQGSNIQLIGASSASNVGNQQVSGFLVDKDGNVTIPMFGPIKIGGLTTHEAKEVITDKVSALYRDPTVQVRFANYKITVLGEVARPATYTVPNEKVTLLDAIGLAGDLTIYGKRDNVLLVRDLGTHKEFVRFDLNSAETFNSPYFYLKQNDVIYVEPGRAKVAANNAERMQIISIIGTITSLLIVALSRFW